MADNLTSKEYTPQELKGRGFKFECETGDGVSLL